MNHTRVLYHMVRADFLERVRRYSFLVTLGFAVYLGYAVYAGQIVLQLDSYRGTTNSAWLGCVIALVATSFLTLVGFYVVKNAIQRDRETRVGQILATTPMSRNFYTLSKTLSNFAVLAAMLLILVISAVAIQLLRGEDSHIDIFALLSPILIFGFCAVAVIAALAVLFETIPGLRGGIGNVVYFFVWTALITLGIASMVSTGESSAASHFADFSGVSTTMGQMQSQLRHVDPQYRGGASLSIGGLNPATRVFLWKGIHWDSTILLSRLLWLAIAFAISMLAALLFDRFDPARLSLFVRSPKSREPSPASAEQQSSPPVQTQRTAAQLTPLPRTGPRARFFTLTLAELRLMLRGHGWWWYLGAAGLSIACLFSPLDSARSGVILAAWLWPVLLWSQLGTREAQFSTRALIFSAQRAFPRQLFAAWSAGVLVAVFTGLGLGLHLLIARNFSGLAPWIAAVIFIPSAALALGVCTESRKPFEALYTAWWYIGPLHHTPHLDFMGTTAISSNPVLYLGATVILLSIALGFRRARLASA